MSLFTPVSITCKRCGHLYTMPVVGSVNADRRPDLRAAILDHTFQDSQCPRCEHSFRMEPAFTYVDAARGQWIASMPAREVQDHRAADRRASALFARAYGHEAPPAAQGLGDTLVPRLTFGWPGIREKVFIRDCGLDDVVVEMVKFDLLRRVENAPLRRGIELRLVSMDNGRLQFDWLDAASEAVLGSVSIGRELYDVIAADAAGWAEVRTSLTDSLFVDMQKSFLAEPESRGTAVAAAA